jgi:hypothetical protein
MLLNFYDGLFILRNVNEESDWQKSNQEENEKVVVAIKERDERDVWTSSLNLQAAPD